MQSFTAYNYYFLGIGGIGMSALARYFHMQGSPVAGYDLSPSAMTDELSKLGIPIHFDADISLIPEIYRDIGHTIVVRTPAVPDDHKELVFFSSNGFRIMKRAEVLGEIFNRKKGIAIAGTHGKTSVTSMTAYIMHCSATGCSAFLGGIMKNLNSNLIVNHESEWVVAEADEYDRSFLHLKPDVALVTWIDADHLDIYENTQAIRESFNQFLSGVKVGGTIILKSNIKPDFDLAGKKLYTYSLDSTGTDFYANDIRQQGMCYLFDIVTPSGLINNVELHYYGITNVENAVAATAAAFAAGVDRDTIGRALSEFNGVQRRFDIQYQNGKHTYIDDYAHHPRELDAIIGSVRKLFPDKKLTGIFQPHLYSRTRDFAAEFAESLGALDELILLDIYPAREKPIEGVSSEIIFNRVKGANKMLCNKNELLNTIRGRNIEVLLTMGAGDIDRYIEKIKTALTGL
jgi:UDP-N-acetylmuramate--alanine ligase